MSLPSLDPYSAAFSHWTRVQEQLAQTIQDYADAGAKLRSALGVYPKDYSLRRLRAEAFSGLNSQLPILASYEESLKEARFSLNITRNISHNLMPINSLPLEILRTIFVMASWQQRDAICAITGVCKLWRQTTLACPSCWSRIELPIGPDSDWHAFGRAELWAERAKNELLHIFVWTRPNNVEDTWYTPYKTIEVVESLCPLMPRVRAIEFLDDILDLSDLVPATLACWAEHGTTGMAEVHRLRAGVYDNRVRITANSISTVVDPTLDEFKSFFGSLRILSLRGAEIDWRLGLYSGLVDLRLGGEGTPQSYSQWDLASILAASPGLRSLALIGIGIGVHGREDSPDPVALNNLHLFQLQSYGENLWAVLRLITSTSDSIQMSLSFENHPKFIPAARSFFERCKVTALHIRLPYLTSSPSMSFWFIPMPHFQHLAIENRSPIVQSWQLSLPTNDCSLDFWPRLDEVYLTKCNLEQQALPQFVSIHEPKILWVHEPRCDGQARDQAEESLQQCSGKLVWVEKWDEMLDVFRKFATGCFLNL